MNCDGFEQALGKPLTDEARAHMATCEACAALGAWFESSTGDPPAMPKIAAFENLKPVRPLPAPGWIAAAALLIGGAVLAIGSKRLGMSGWEALEPFQRISIFGGLAVAGAASSYLLSQQMFPTLSRRISPPLCVGAALAGIVIGGFAIIPFDPSGASMIAMGMSCGTHGLLYSAAAGIGVWLLVRRGYFVQPGWAGALTGLVSGIAALGVLELYCPLIERTHVLGWHAGVVAVSVLLASALAWLFSKRSA